MQHIPLFFLCTDRDGDRAKEKDGKSEQWQLVARDDRQMHWLHPNIYFLLGSKFWPIFMFDFSIIPRVFNGNPKLHFEIS